ncbi:YkoP family protein [Desmospora activa]|uniref:YkoP-like domain-containing protein n=1 Tax=Desmospora activa DSM 45169 TaxID=1121389 RepID=A0A2T4ZBU6_9BACL|nr:hypothetical protein [Desmospora activa]PTM59358.1 hypothetical protein C8J48_1973 [Desmospora activa DSM 45169]
MVTGGIIHLWRVVDWIYFHISRLQYVDQENQNLFRVVIKRYRGESLTTRDGVKLHPGDRYAKLHLHNWRLAQLLRSARKNGGQSVTALRMELMVMRRIRQSLPALAMFINQHPHSEEIQVLAGTTFLFRGADHLGFDIADFNHPWKSKSKTMLLKLILLFCQPTQWKQLYSRRGLVPKRVFISRHQLNRTYKMRTEP